LKIPPGADPHSDVGNYPAQDVLCLTTGTQGEPMSALSRIAIDDHRYVKVGLTAPWYCRPLVQAARKRSAA
jgi:ribonuclease J